MSLSESEEDSSKGVTSCGEMTLRFRSVWFAADIGGIVLPAGRSRTGAERATGNGGGGGNSSIWGGGELGGISA